MNVDEVLKYIGEFGLYQKKMYVLFVLSWTSSYTFMVSAVFYMEIQDHRCKIPGLINDTYAIQSDGHRALVNKYIPHSEDNSTMYDRCHLLHYDEATVLNNSIGGNSSQIKCTEWVYSTELLQTTVISSFNLVCDDAYRTSIEGTVHFFGVLIGSYVTGTVSDTIGRRKSLLASTLVLFCSSLGLAWAPNFIVFLVLRFIIGFSNIGMSIVAYVLGMEWVGPSKRTVAGLIIACLCSLGQLYLTLVSYLVRKWNYTEIAMAIPVGLLFLSFLTVPESPRWLLARGRVDELKQHLERAAKVNGKPMPDNIMTETTINTKNETGKFWLLFTSKTLFFRTLIILCNWVVVVLSFYGLTFNISNLHGDFFLNFTISVLIELPAGLLPIFLVDRFGRKRVHSVFMIVGGVACLSTILTVTYATRWSTTVFAMIGKFFVTAAFSTVYIMSVELFPTVVRNAAMGICSSCSWIGAMISPYIVGLADTVDGNTGVAVPLVICGSASLFAGGLALLLPETMNRDLPETIDDAKDFPKRLPKSRTTTDNADSSVPFIDSKLNPSTQQKDIKNSDS